MERIENLKCFRIVTCLLKDLLVKFYKGDSCLVLYSIFLRHFYYPSSCLFSLSLRFYHDVCL